MDEHRKGLLASGNYHATVKQSYPAHKNPNKKHLKNDTLVILWSIDSGEFKRRNLQQTFDADSDLDMWNLSKIADRLNFDHYGPEHEDFYDQWEGLRAKLKVTVDLSDDSRFKKNVILEHSLPERPAEIDVTADKDNSHFHSNKKGRDLPV